MNLITSTQPPPDPRSFIANKPFYFFLLDRDTKTILFSGYLKNPV